MQEVSGSKPCTVVCFCKKSSECCEKKIHQQKPQILQKFTAFNAKRCGRFAVKFFFTAIHR